MIPHIVETQQVIQLFAHTETQINDMTNKAIEQANANLVSYYAIPLEQRDYKNTALFLDMLIAKYNITTSILRVIEYVHPDEKMRDAAHHNVLKLSANAIDNFYLNKVVYNAFRDYVEKNSINEDLNDEEKYFLEEQMKAYRLAGHHLPLEKFERLKNIYKELEEHTSAFERNISMDTRKIEVGIEDLAGLSQNFIAGLRKTDSGKYILGVDYPTYYNVMENCSVNSTRKALWKEFVNRAYPANSQELEQIIALRDEIAKLIGYDTFAHLDLTNQMVKSPEKAYSFLQDLINKTQVKVDQEMAILMKNLPENIALTQDNKFNPWDLAYVKSSYKKKYLSIDEELISEYFPLNHTIDSLLKIYEEFFNIKFVRSHVNQLWDKHVEYIKVYKGDNFLGTLLMDLHPRPGKFTHACFCSVVPSVKTKDDNYFPGVGLIIANFPWPVDNNPALIHRSDVVTFFHEFGHAIHGILGATQMPSFSGTDVKRDFVEMPSQMFEEWLGDAEILKRVSKHYKTGQSLSDELIAKIVEVKKFDSGYWVQRQVFYALLSLNYYGSGAYKDLNKIFKDTFNSVIKHVEYNADNHDFASFGHLTGYAAKYYGYLWSKVFAIDIFEHIRELGLLNPEIGQKFAATVLEKGGSIDPNKLIFNFLSREPRIDGFIKNLGL